MTVLLHHSMVKLPEEPMQPAEVRRPRRLLHRGVRGLRRHQEPPGRGRPATSPAGGWRRRTRTPRSPSRRSRSSSTSAAKCPTSGAPGSRRASRRGSPPSRRPASRTRSSPRTPPLPQEDPDWDPEDARYSSIRWLPSTIENAMGPHVHDPRTGEILESDILMYHNVLKLVRDWYFVQASPNDPKAPEAAAARRPGRRAARLRRLARGRATRSASRTT